MGAADKITDWSIVGIGSADGLHPPIRSKTCLMSALTCGLMEVKHIKEISNWRYELWVEVMFRGIGFSVFHAHDPAV